MDFISRGKKANDGISARGTLTHTASSFRCDLKQFQTNPLFSIQVIDRAQNFGSGLVARGARTNPDQRIGIYSQNRVEWTLTEKACNGYSMVVVPLYDTLGPQAITWILEQCEYMILSAPCVNL